MNKTQQREETMKKIVVEIKNSDPDKQNFILGYLEALKDINTLNVQPNSKEANS